MSQLVRCRECRHFVKRLARGERVEIVGTVNHSDDADPDHEVVSCSSCGTLHELRRLGSEEAA